MNYSFVNDTEKKAPLKKLPSLDNFLVLFF